MWTGHEIYIFTYELPTYIRMWLDIYRYTEKLKHKKKPTGEVNIIDHVVQIKCCHLTCSGQPDTKKHDRELKASTGSPDCPDPK